MTTLREAAELALEALESCQDGDYTTGDVRQSFDEQAVNAAIVALWAALAQDKQEPVMHSRDALDAAAAAELEACARVCEETTAAWTQHLYNEGCMDCAKAIRARGEK